jgi:hypothetical protein
MGLHGLLQGYLYLTFHLFCKGIQVYFISSQQYVMNSPSPPPHNGGTGNRKNGQSVIIGEEEEEVTNAEEIRTATYCSWLRHYAKSRKVAGSILDGAVGFFSWPDHSSHTMAPGVYSTS